MAELPSRVIDKTVRRFGCLPRVSRPGDGMFPIFAAAPTATPELIPRSKWDQYKDISLRDHVWMIKDQGSQGSCTAAATCGAVQLVREFMGMRRIHLSQAVIYGMGNGGSDSGMPIDTALRILQETGSRLT